MQCGKWQVMPVLGAFVLSSVVGALVPSSVVGALVLSKGAVSGDLILMRSHYLYSIHCIHKNDFSRDMTHRM